MSWEDAYKDLMFEPQEEESVEGSSPYAFENRGTAMDLLSSGARGVANVASLTGSGLEQLGVSNPLEDWAKKAREGWDFLKPDVSEAMGLEGPVVSGLKSIPETVVTSVGSAIPGVIVGGAYGGAPGALAGGVGNMLLTMGLGTFKEKKDEYLEKNPGDEDGAFDYAMIHAGSEVGLEALSNVTALTTFGASKLLSAVGKQGVKATARNLLSLSGKDLAKATGISAATELGTEEATYGIQASADERYGMGEGPTMEGAIETGVATLGMSLVFAGAGTKYSYDQKKRLKNGLESESKLAQTSAANAIRLDLEKSGDMDLAQAWDSYTSNAIENGQPIKLDDNFVELGNKIKEAETFQVQDLVSSNPDTQKAAAEKIFADNGLNLDGTFIGPKTFEEDLEQYLPETEEAQAERLFKEEEGRAKAYTYFKNQPKRTLGEVATGATEQELRDFVGNLGPESWLEREDAPLATPGRQPSPTVEDIQNQELEVEAEAFQKASLLYNQGKNTQNRTKAALMLVDFQNQREATLSKEEAAAKAEETNRRNKLMEEAMPSDPNTNDLEPLSEDEAKAILHTNLSNYKKSVGEYMDEATLIRMAELRESPNTVIRTLMSQLKPDTNAVNLDAIIKKAEEVEAKAIKGSSQAKDASAVVKSAKKLKEAKVKAVAAAKVKVEKATQKLEEAKSVPLPGKPTAPIVSEAPALIEDDKITVGSLAETKGVESATTLTPEDILQNKETLESNPNLIEEPDAVDTSDEGVLKRAANSTGDTLLMSIMKENTTGIDNALKDIAPAKRQAAVVESLKKLGKGAIEYEKLLAPKVKIAMDRAKVKKQKDLEGSKGTDAIEWEINETGSEETVQKGKHKESGKEVFIMNVLQSYDPTQEGQGEEIDVKDLSDQWEVYVDGKLVETVKGKVKARQAVEKHVAPLSKEALEKQKEAKSRAGKKQIKVSEETKEVLKDYGKKKETSKETKEENLSGEVKTLDKSAFMWDPVAGKLVPKPKEDQADTSTIRRRPAKDKVLRDPLEIIQEQAEDTPDKLARNLLERAKGDRMEASLLAQYIKNEANREAVLEKLEDLRYRVVDDILSPFINRSSKTSPEYQLAKMLRELLNKSGKGNISVVIDPTISSLYFTSLGEGAVHIRNLDLNPANLHEVWHSITSRELDANKELRDEVRKLMSLVEEKVINDSSYSITREDIDRMRKSGETSKAFKEEFGEENFGGDRGILYALLNEKEFLAQVANSQKIRDLYDSIELKEKRGIIKTVYQEVVNIFLNIFKKGRIYKTALEKAFELTEQLSMVDISGLKVGVQENQSIDTNNPKKTREEIEKEIDSGIKKHLGKDKTQTFKDSTIGFLKGAETNLSKITQSTYEALAEIGKPLAEALRQMDMKGNQAIKRRTQEANPFERKYRKLPKLEKQIGALYMRNTGDIYSDRLADWLKKHKLTEEWKKLQDVRKEVYDDAEVFGLNEYDFMDNTIPLYVKDYEGLISYLRKQEDWGMIDEVIKAAEDAAGKKGKPLGDNDRAQIVTDMLFTGRMPMPIIRKPSSLKQRTVGVITPGMLEYYADPVESLGRFIREMTERIEINRMLGLTGYKEKRNAIRSKIREIEKLHGKGEKGQKLQPLLDELFELQDALPTIEAQIEGGIGKLLADMVKSREITEREQQRAKDLIRARVTQVGTNRFGSAIRSAALLGSLTQLSTGLRNISDIVWSMYNNGTLNTLSAAIKVATGNATLKSNPFDFQNPLKEYSTVTRFVDSAIKMSGLMYVDNFMKLTNMEASLTKAKKQSKEEFSKSWKEIFRDKTDQVYNDIQEGRMTENVEYLLFSDISNFQPITLSEMPEVYLRAGNGRILYLLKAYSLKSVNNFYRESIKKIRNGDVKGGVQNLVHLGTLFLMVGANTDWLIDWLNGKQPDFTDSMVDTLLTLGITSKYTLDKSKKEGLIKGQAGNMIPSTAIFDLPFGDLMNLLEGKPTLKTLRLMPGVGAFSYNHLSEDGKKTVINASKEKFYEGAANSKKLDVDMLREINRSVRNYNKNFSPKTPLKEITPGSISSAKKKAQKEEEE